MALDVYWDSDFKVRTLQPVFVDGGGQISPIAMAATIELEVPTTPKSSNFLEITADGTEGFEIHISLDGLTYELGHFRGRVTSGVATAIPLQNVEKVKFVQLPGGSATLFYFQFLVNS